MRGLDLVVLCSLCLLGLSQGLRDAVNQALAARGTMLRVAIKDWELPPGIDGASLQQSAGQRPADARPLPENSPHREFVLRALGAMCGGGLGS